MNFLADTENIMFADQNSYTKSKKRHIVDLHSSKMIKRCEDLLALFDRIFPKFSEFKVQLIEPKLGSKTYIKRIDKFCLHNAIEPQMYFDTVENLLKSRLGILEEHIGHLKNIKENRVKLVERQMAVRSLNDLFPKEYFGPTGQSVEYDQQQTTPLKSTESLSSGSKLLNCIFGFIETGFLMKFLQIINRVGRELVEVRTKNMILTDNFASDPEYCSKSLVVIYFLMSGKNVMREKITAVLNNFGFIFLNNLNGEFNASANEVKQALNENESIGERTEETVRSLLESLAGLTILSNLSDVFSHLLVVKRELRFAQNLVYLKHKNGFNQLLLWVAQSSYGVLKGKLEELDVEEFGFVKPKLILEDFGGNDDLHPPTLLASNPVISLFQEIVNIYGIPKYQEINPAVFMIVSFPFFFGLMFGDVCHGLILFGFGYYVSLSQSKVWEDLKKVSLVLMMMGFFSMYCGLVYNQFFSVSFVTQVGCYDPQTLANRNVENCHSFGLDWVWSIAKNATAFLNSFKMKFSIIIGVSQMLLGLLLKLSNTIFFGNYIDLCFEAIPQFLFMMSTFGYMLICIIIKWTTEYIPGQDVSILSVFINFPFVKKSLFGGPGVQQSLQITLLMIIIVCIVLMYIPKPILLFYKHKNEIRYHTSAVESQTPDYLEHSMISVY